MSLRDRKRARTRQALIDAATDLFGRQGYDATTVADIAAAAEIGTRTFFGYFATKEDLLFPDADARVQAVAEAIASRTPEDGPTDVLLRALVAAAEGTDLLSPLAALRLELVRTVPAVRGRGLQLQLEAQQTIAGQLAEAFPEQLDALTAAALTGAFVGAITGALQVLLAEPARDPEALRAALRTATDVALTPWRRNPAA
ncbi:TetR/AcrR family transcriptional regulator [Kitasatospora sp. NPDC051170]|uniref:TetR/AcrR family transcriptional regulator n=1 Tax=Kitasatospora sp. NPDC051170 TaxID=3364056 RepID=UPI0037A4D1AC